MNKDVIYIDVEDDITAIIGKIKASKEKIVALVPPKRIGVLQSAVNLHLLVRMAKNADKQLVLVTNNQALIALSAASSIPVAKNLQSKPELASIPALAVDDSEDIIDGAQLPVGELASTADEPDAPKFMKKRADVDTLVDTIDGDEEEVLIPAAAAGAATAAASKKVHTRSNVKVPNFSRFRKKLFLGIAALIVLVGFLIWANVFAPAATIVITAKTISSPISQTVTLGAAATDVKTSTIQAVTQTLQKSVSVKFTPTGTEDLGASASGTISLVNCDSSSTVSIPSGTTFTASSGQTYTNATATSVPGFTGSAHLCNANGTGAGTRTVNVTATASGPNYNIAATSYTINGASDDNMSANGSAMTGGTTNVQTVVSASDVAAATTALNALSTTADEQALISQYKNGEYVITSSFNVSRATPVSSPAVGAQASSSANSATLSTTITYTISALARPDVELFLKAALNQQINGATDQRIYDDGISKVVLAGYNNSNGPATVNIATTGQVGPNIDIDSVKLQAEGKKSGEVQAQLETIDGVSDAEVKFSFPWVTTVPKNASKVDVQFNLTNG